MKAIKQLGLVIFIGALTLFTALSFIGNYTFDEATFNALDDHTRAQIGDRIQKEVLGKEYGSGFSATAAVLTIASEHNAARDAEQDWNNKVFNADHKGMGLVISRASVDSPVKENKGLWLFLTFGLGIIGSLMYILPNVILMGPAGIKNNGIYLESATNKGLIGWIALVYLVGFYILLYFYPDLMINQILLTDPIKNILIPGAEGSQWFLYGLLYCVVMVVMGVRMFIKYRHNKYQMVRTGSVLFFQIAFAFLIPEIMTRFNMPYMDLKNAWPLDYDFLFKWNVDDLIGGGNVGLFMLFWGVALTLVIVPVLVYMYGKRWYCSWVCGCGGLAETLGDPYRQHSDKSLKAWKFERYIIHIVLVLALVMTVATVYSYLHQNPDGYWLSTGSFLGILGILTVAIATIILIGKGEFQTIMKKHKMVASGIGGVLFLLTAVAFFTGGQNVIFIDSGQLQSSYGFVIGSVFSGVIGTGFYPIFGNRVWCRFGCPLAAYMGLVQKIKSRFRITTNGGQCISCGNCSTYCEQGIDVRAYAQRGQNIVRSSCVGCGVCAAVCPRGVLKLENGPEEGRINHEPLMIGNANPIKLTKDGAEIVER